MARAIRVGWLTAAGGAGVAAAAACALLLAGCSGSSSKDPFAGIGSPRWEGAGAPPKGGGREMVGEPYEVAGRWFYPREDTSYDRTGRASWYGEAFHKRMTSNGEWFDMDYLSAAHATMPLPSYVKVTNVENGRAVVLRVNDRGPFVGDRIIDVSKKAAQALDFQHRGTANVRVQYLGPAPVDDKGSHLASMNRALSAGAPDSALTRQAGTQGGGQPSIAPVAFQP
jgi:rare lipoprotein A